jgi:hypothetical protein
MFRVYATAYEQVNRENDSIHDRFSSLASDHHGAAANRLQALSLACSFVHHVSIAKELSMENA